MVASGDPVYASDVNLASARLFQNSAGTSLTDNTNTAITFDSESWDTDGMHSTSVNTSRVTITSSAGAGIYVCRGTVHLPGRSDYTTIGACIAKNGTNLAPFERWGPNTASVARTVTVECRVQLVVGDYVELIGFQDNTANVAVTTAFGASSFTTVLEVQKLRT